MRNVKHSLVSHLIFVRLQLVWLSDAHLACYCLLSPFFHLPSHISFLRWGSCWIAGKATSSSSYLLLEENRFVSHIGSLQLVTLIWHKEIAEGKANLRSRDTVLLFTNVELSFSCCCRNDIWVWEHLCTNWSESLLQFIISMVWRLPRPVIDGATESYECTTGSFGKLFQTVEIASSCLFTSHGEQKTLTSRRVWTR